MVAAAAVAAAVVITGAIVAVAVVAAAAVAAAVATSVVAAAAVVIEGAVVAVAAAVVEAVGMTYRSRAYVLKCQKNTYLPALSNTTEEQNELSHLHPFRVSSNIHLHSRYITSLTLQHHLK